MNGGEEVGRELVVASSDAPKVLEPAEHALDGVAPAIEEGAEAALPATVGLERDVRYRTAVLNEAADGIRVIGLVGHHDGAFRHGLKQRQCLRCIGGIAARQQEGQRPTMTIAHSMQLGVPAATAYADHLAECPPLFHPQPSDAP